MLKNGNQLWLGMRRWWMGQKCGLRSSTVLDGTAGAWVKLTKICMHYSCRMACAHIDGPAECT